MSQSKRPYKLPKNLTIDADKIKNGVSYETLKKYIEYNEERFPRLIYLEKLYDGFHDILHQPEKEEWKPDNRLIVNFAREMTETFLGYYNGVPISETHPDENINESFLQFQRQNEIDDHESELIKTACKYGHAFEYIYQDENARTKMTVLNPMECFVVYDNTLKNHALFAVRYGYKEDLEHSGIKKLYGEILEKYQITPFNDQKLLEPYDNVYGYIPVVEYRLNDERMGLYEPAAGLIEAYNQTLSFKKNDIDEFAEAYLAVIGAELDDDGYKKIRDNRLINIYGTDDPKEILVNFLSRPSADGSQENLLNRLEDLIYRVCMISNITDDTFGNATSGRALAYKLKPMSDLARVADRKVSKSLKKRYKIFCSLSTNCPNPNAWEDLDIKTTRNTPEEILSITEQVQAVRDSEGIVSHKTQLEHHPYVVNVDDELERLQNEEADAMSARPDLSLFRQRQNTNTEDTVTPKQEG